MFRLLFKTILLIVDVILFIILFFLFILIAVIYCRFIYKNCKSRLRKLLVLPSSGNIDEAINKFGTLDVMLAHNPQGFFYKIYICFFPAKKNLERRINNSAIVYDIKLSRNFKCLSVLRYIIKLFNLIRFEEITLVRALSPYAVGFAGRVVSSLYGVPFCVSVHEDYDKRISFFTNDKGERVLFSSRFLAKKLEQIIFKTADLVLPIRDSLRTNIINSGINKDKVITIPHGVDIRQFENVDISNFRKKITNGIKFLVVSVCRHSADNYVLDIVEIANILAKKRTDFMFIMAGDGVLHGDVKDKIYEYNLGDLVKVTGFIPHEEAIKYWISADVAICLMGGFSLIEAALAGKPVISYDVEWHYELVINSKTGFLLKERDIEGAVNALNILFGNEDARKEYGLSICKLAKSKHSLEIADKIKIDCYKKLLGQ